jgi:ABC-2 type transport system ATP-binding protein
MNILDPKATHENPSGLLGGGIEPAIVCRDLTKKFGHFIAVDHISFEVKPGEIFGFLGANGAGKTTAMRMLSGLSFPTSGMARVGGFDVYHQQEKIKKNIGYMSQKFSLYENLTPLENIRFFAGIYGVPRKEIRERSRDLINTLGLSDNANTLVASLPLGWKQKLAFSVAIFHEPKIVFLDEPTGGVDPVTRRQFWDMIYEAAERGITIFVTTHYMDEAEYCDRVTIMVDGKIEALDTPQALKQSFNVSSIDDVFYQLARGAKRTDN